MCQYMNRTCPLVSQISSPRLPTSIIFWNILANIHRCVHTKGKWSCIYSPSLPLISSKKTHNISFTFFPAEDDRVSKMMAMGATNASETGCYILSQCTLPGKLVCLSGLHRIFLYLYCKISMSSFLSELFLCFLNDW